jgi:pimeloyl-ACP methyl ester carboxylesterase
MERVADDGHDLARVPDRSQRNKGDAVAVGVGKACGGLDRQARLSDPTRPDERQQSAGRIIQNPGVLPLPFSELKSPSPILNNPFNDGRATGLSYEQFRFAFANAVDDDEARRLYATYAVPAEGPPPIQAATAIPNPWTEANVDTENPERGPLLILSGQNDHTVPWAVANASFKLQARNPSITEIREMPGRGHSLTIDHAWQDVAEVVLTFIAQHTAKGANGAYAVLSPAAQAESRAGQNCVQPSSS